MEYYRIRALREDKDLTQEQMGKEINVPQRTYAYYETGERMIPPDILVKIALFHGVSVYYLLNLTNDKDFYGNIK